MQSLLTFVAPPHACSYLPDRTAAMRYEVVSDATPAEYQARMQAGWRRFGFSLFRPDCPTCTACRTLRVDVPNFRPNQSQKRAWKANADLTVTVGEPSVTDEKLDLYDRYHRFQSAAVGWAAYGPKDPADYADTFVDNPFPTEEWCYRLNGQLVGVGYVDALPAGLSAIYFFYDPEMKDRSLGTFNVLKVIEAARGRGLPHVYLGFFVEGCRSLEYKGRFRPNEVLVGGEWTAFRE